MPDHRLTAYFRQTGKTDPTPLEIRAACAMIQATWDEDEERSRRTGTVIESIWSVPQVRCRRSEPEAADAYCGR